jgi:hypothetical protein
VSFTEGVVFLSATLTERLIEFARSFWGEAENDAVNHTRADMELLIQIEEARREWLDAQSFFESAVDPALVDYAVLSLQAAEKKYVYLLNLAKKYSLTHEAYSATAIHRIE